MSNTANARWIQFVLSLLGSKSPLQLSTTLESPIHAQIQIMRRTSNSDVFVENLNIIENLHNSQTVFEDYLLQTIVRSSSMFYLNQLKIQDLDPHIFPNFKHSCLKDTLFAFLPITFLGTIENVIEDPFPFIKWNIRTQKNEYLEFITTNMYNFETFKPKKYPVSLHDTSLINYTMIDYLVNDAYYIFDFMTRKKSEKKFSFFILDTLLLNKYERKPNFPPLGCKAFFVLRKTGFFLKQFIYQNKIYRRNAFCREHEIPLYILLKGILQYGFVCSHALQSHFMISGKITNLDHIHFPIIDQDQDGARGKKIHPIRQLFLPFEINTNQGTIEGFMALGNNNLVKISTNFTDKGIVDMLGEYYINYKHEFMNFVSATKPLFPKLHLTDDELECHPIRTYHTYHKIFKNFANVYVEQLYDHDRDIEPNVVEWMEAIYHDPNRIRENKKKEVLKTIIASAFFEQVRHTMLSNYSFLYLLVQYPNLYLSGDDYFVDNSYVMSILFGFVTVTELVPMTKNLSFLIEDRKLRNIYQESLHEKIMQFENEFRRCISNQPNRRRLIDVLKPSSVSTSTGY